MESKLKTLLYDEKEATKKLKVATVAMRCDREPSVNRARMVKMTEAIKRAHPDVELVLYGDFRSTRIVESYGARYLVCELGFDANQSWLKRIIGNMIVKAPLPFHVLRNWRRVREYR